jgi:hypothetical protein
VEVKRVCGGVEESGGGGESEGGRGWGGKAVITAEDDVAGKSSETQKPLCCVNKLKNYPRQERGVYMKPSPRISRRLTGAGTRNTQKPHVSAVDMQIQAMNAFLWL